MNVELKEINKSKVIFILEPFSDKIKDFLILSKNSENIKKLDNYFYDLISNRIKNIFEDRPYNLNYLKNDLDVLYGIKIDNNKIIDYSTSSLLRDVYLKIKYEEISWHLSFLKEKITKEGQKKVIDAIYKVELTRETFSKIIEISKKIKIDPVVLSKEIKYLSMIESIELSNKKIKIYE